MKRNKYIIGNWKMNGTGASIKIVNFIVNHVKKRKQTGPKIVICPPFTLLSNFNQLKDKISFGGQDCHYANEGAYTGSISALMLKSLGCKYVIIGHSERREFQKEQSKELNLKIKAALENNLNVVYCIGEKLSEIKKRKTILKNQINSLPDKFDIKKIIIAYEPVWAIGTGNIPCLNEIDDIHRSIRKLLEKKIGVSKSKTISILYGGSVKPSNADEILNLKQVDGALVGGSSLVAKDFCKIIDSSKH